MSYILKAFLACLLTIPCLYGSQTPQESVYAIDNGPLHERKIIAPLEEVELCRRLFRLQAECDSDNTQTYMLYGGLLGTGLGAAKYLRRTTSWRKLLKICALAAAGAIIGGIASIMSRPGRVKSIRTERTSFYFPEEYMAKLQNMLNHGNHVCIHTFKDSDQAAIVGEHELAQWHALAQSKYCFVCYRHERTGQLIAEVPYYSPEARVVYKDRDAVLRDPISYDQIQELNRFCGNASSGHSTASMLYSHDERQDWLGCDQAWRPRRIGLPALSRYINKGSMVEDLANREDIVEIYDINN